MNSSTLSGLADTINQVSRNGGHIMRSCIFALAAAASTASVLASDIDKANNADNLNLVTSWTGGIVPGPSDIAVWNSTVAGANTVALGDNLTWDGISIQNPGGPVVITADGNTLTNGLVNAVGNLGIDLSGNQDLTLSNNLVINGVQGWNISSGRTLRIGGNLLRNAGGVVRFNFADSGSTVIVTNGSDVISTTASPNAMLGSTYGNIFFGTINDVDYAALVDAAGGFQVVQGNTLGIYTENAAGTTPTDPGSVVLMDFGNTASGSSGSRLGNTRTYNAMRFNTPQINTTVTYNGLPAWQVWIPSGRTLTINSILVTTNEGNSPILINNGGPSGGTIGNLRVGNGGTQDLLVFQNNPAAPLIVQPTVNMTQQGTGNLVKMGAGMMEIQSPSVTYAGGTKVYGGTLMIDGTGNVGVGPLNVFGGNFAGSSTAVNYAPTVVFSGATNSVMINGANGSFLQNSNLTFNAGSHLQFVYSNSLSPSATAAALMVTNVSGGLVVSNAVIVNVICGNLALGQFPLIKYAGALGGDGGGAFAPGILEPHASGYISNNLANNSIDLVVTNITQPLTWAVGNAVWDTTTGNWKDNLGNTTTYQEIGSLADNVVFDDSASGISPITVTLNSTVIPNSVTFNNSTKDYIISGSGDIGGNGGVTKSGSGTLSLQTTNSFTGGLNVNGGVLSFTSLANLGGGAINFDGGTLQYGSGDVDDISTRTVTFNAGGGTIDDGGNSLNFVYPIGNNGTGGLAKMGAGTLVLNGTNSYSGNTVVVQGTLALSASTYVSTYIRNSAAIIVDGGATLDASGDLDESGNVIGLPLSSAVGQILAGTGTVNGEVAAPAGTGIMPATNGVYGTLTFGNDLSVSGGILALDVSSSSSDLIVVNGNLTLNSGAVQLNISGTLPNGTYKLIQYSGSLLSGSGSSGNLALTGFSQAGQSAYLIDSTSGEIDLVVATAASDSITWGAGPNWDLAGTMDWFNGAAPWAFTNGDLVTFDDSGSPTVNLQTSLRPGSVTVNSSQNYTFADGTGSGGGKLSGQVGITKSGTGTLIIQTANNNNGPTVINAGTVQVGNGGIGDIGLGNITNNGALVFAQGDNAVHNVPGVISGSGSVAENGSATVVLAQNNTYSGATTISAGTLQVGNGGASGSLGSNLAVTNNGTLVFDRSGSLALANNISGSGSLLDIGSGAVTFTGSLTYQGDTSISNGIVKLTANDQIPNGATVVGSTGILGSSGIFDLNGFNQTVNGLTSLGLTTGYITNSAASGTNVLTVGLPSINVTNTFSGQIADNSSRGRVELVFNSPGNETLDCPTNTYSGGTIVGLGTLTLGVASTDNGNAAAGVGNITMSNGTSLYIGHSTFVTNPIVIAPDSTVTFGSTSLGSSLSGPVSGDAQSTNIIIDIGGQGISSQGVGQWDNFPGTVLIADGGELRVYANPGGGTNTTFDVEGSGILHTRTTEYLFLGKLVGNGSITTPQSGGTGNIVIGTKNEDDTFPGFISGDNNLYKAGTGTLTLNGATNFTTTLNGDGSTTTNYFLTNVITYVGSTTISNGVLAVDAPNNFNLTNFTSFTLASSTAVLDLSSAGYSPDNVTLVTNSTLTLTAPQALTGLGTIRGSLVAGSGTTVSVALAPDTNGSPVTGTLDITGSAELGGAINLNINATNSPNSGEIMSPSITIDPTATLVVTNLGPEAGATFHLFNQAVQFANGAVTLPTLTGTNTWQNNLAVDGSITLIAPPLSTVNTTPTNIVFSVTGNTLTLSWPGDHLGWILQAQTNDLSTGISTNWVDVPGSDAGTNAVMTINPANPTVFYRLIYRQ